MSLLGNHKSNADVTAPKAKAHAATDLATLKKKASDERVSLRIDADKRELFKRACMRNMSTMSTELEKFIDDYIEKNPE